MVILEQDIVEMIWFCRIYSREREGGVCGFVMSYLVLVLMCCMLGSLISSGMEGMSGGNERK